MISPEARNAIQIDRMCSAAICEEIGARLRIRLADEHDRGAVAELVGIEVGVVSGVINLESSGVEASDWRPRHDEHYHEV